ncbi:ATP-binding protein [Aggregatilineales bacterium SYSU G02658]
MTTPTTTSALVPYTLAAQASNTDIEEALAGLANYQGGMLHVHLDDSADGETIIDRVLEAALTLDPPLILPLPRIVDHKVIVHVPAGMPHVYATSAGRYVVYHTSQITNLPSRELRRLMMLRGALSFESTPAEGANRSDLDWHKVNEYAASLAGYSAATAESLLLQRGCLVDVGGTLRPTYAGILLFGKDPQRFVRGATISAVHFDGTVMTDTHTRQDLSGTLIDQIRHIEPFLRAHLRREVRLGDTMAREEQYEYPMEAARELIINALAHRDYSIQGDYIRVLVFTNRFEVHSPGGLPGYMTLENLKDERFSRNPIIVQVLSDMLYIERLGYGVDRVIELMQSHGLRAPEFIERAGGFQVVLYNSREEAAVPSPASTVSLTELIAGHDLNPRQERALTLLLESPSGRLTNSDLQAQFQEIHSETIRRDLVDLVKKGILLKMGQKRGSYYVLRRAAPEQA